VHALGKTLARIVQPAVMAALAKEPLHGYLIVQRLGTMAMFRGQSPDPTGVYRVLKSMERDGLVESTWDMAGSGPARHCYALTPAGHACLEQWLLTLKTYQKSIGELVRTLQHASRRRK